MENTQKNPVLWKIVVILLFVVGSMELLFIILGLFGAIVLNRIDWLLGGIFNLAISIGYLLSAYGLMKVRKWALLMLIAVISLKFAAYIVGYFNTKVISFETIIEILIGAFILIYLILLRKRFK
ncbi:MAG: hypothetical protein A3J65_04170 [Candidatus Buchananbacteria bacterium RIFCSPHIGHO2_02_FULL_45_11b]|uniref:DUF2127 domain-containing protein n=1 Tax=Candidatus Buchananbacteria bacterium RIFCSPHIGHO2_02_FULL_45_11b TaxID=1797541 RepID=A0A1G1YJU2_9BACT|nr:MAG: hypothetical protein A3J65_04170 [Candidatus Buchananbacteria bacterium RIFCSPHIGHO2_02_FULL_45_11b]